VNTPENAKQLNDTMLHIPFVLGVNTPQQEHTPGIEPVKGLCEWNFPRNKAVQPARLYIFVFIILFFLKVGRAVTDVPTELLT